MERRRTARHDVGGGTRPSAPSRSRCHPPRAALSIDGFHQVDFQTCIAAHTCPHLVDLADHGTTYTRASTTKPSDSFPGLLAQLTGGTPKSTGVYYDDSYDRTLFAPAANSSGPCTAGPGAETQYAENLGVNKHSIDSGVNATLTGLNSAVGIDPNQLPARMVDGKCLPVWPHDFVRTNTIFGVLHHHHFRTAWSDKHVAYDIINGDDPEAQPTTGQIAWSRKLHTRWSGVHRSLQQQVAPLARRLWRRKQESAVRQGSDGARALARRGETSARSGTRPRPEPGEFCRHNLVY